MTGYLRSGRRRDICAVLYGTDGLRGQELKARLETAYGSRIKPKTFYGALDSLVDAGHVEERANGIHDVYALSEAGEDALDAHYEWLTGQLDQEQG